MYRIIVSILVIFNFEIPINATSSINFNYSSLLLSISDERGCNHGKTDNGHVLSRHQYLDKEDETYHLKTLDKLSTPIIVLHESINHVCPHSETIRFMNSIRFGELDSLPNIEDNYSIEKNGLLNLHIESDSSYAVLKLNESKVLKDQTLTTLQSDFQITVIPSTINDSLPIAFFISGDGGWGSFDKELSKSLAAIGITVVGFDSQKYFWSEKTPEETSVEVTKVVEWYLQQWKKSSFILIGYSFGAGIVPFIANRLPSQLKTSLISVFCLSPDVKCDFEIHVADMLNFESSTEKYNVLNETKSILAFHPVCIFGKDEPRTLRKSFYETGAKIILLPGSHRYKDDFSKVANVIYNNIK